MKYFQTALTCLALLLLHPVNSHAQNAFNESFEKIVFGCYAGNLDDFEVFVQRAKASGATHINLSNEDLPSSRWEYDTENDPYPAWVITNMGLLKIASPEALKPYLPQDYAEKVMSILEERCKVLRKYGMKAAFKTFEPQMLPEQVYSDHPLWRGPRVDHPSRSRVARWAPDVDNPEVLDLYRESFTMLLERCPEIEMISLTTNDSGTGLSWSGGLYSGSSGNTNHKYRRTEERISSFFAVFMEVAKSRGASLDIDFMGTREAFPERIAENLSAGMAIENLEGPGATPYRSQVGYVMDYYQLLYPVVGVPDPVQFLEELENARVTNSKRLIVLLGDRFNKELYFEIFDRFNTRPTKGIVSRLLLLEELASDLAGEEAAAHLLNLWLYLNEARQPVQLINLGGAIFYMGCVQQRWLTRPFVPFPEELNAADKDYYRNFQFQALSESRADDMADTQASRAFSGWSGQFFIFRTMNAVKVSVMKARAELEQLQDSDTGDRFKDELHLLDLRLRALEILCNNAKNAISYQAQSDRAKRSPVDPDSSPDIGTPSSWGRSLMLETARQEIDNTALMIELLESNPELILDTAPTEELEDIRRLGPDLTDQLRQKLRIMNEHWLDYNRLFPIPNL